MTLPNKIADAGPYSHEAHKIGFGASEAAPACGLSDHGTPLKIYAEKTGDIEPFEGNDATRLGDLLQPVIQSEFTHRTGIRVIESPMGLYQSVENPFVLATPDADLETGDLGEWKSTTFRTAAKLGEQETDDLPSDWVCQCQQQMYVMERERVQVAVLIDGRTLKTYQVERNDRLIEGIVEAERELWERIENRDPPEPNWKHPRTPQLIREMYGIADALDVMTLSETAVKFLEQRKRMLNLAKEYKKAADEDMAHVLHEIGNAIGGIIPGTGKMIRRKMVERKGYTVEPTSFIEVREVNAPKPIFERA